MPSTILSDNGASSGSAGLKTTAASDGILALQTTTAGGTVTTAVTIDTSQNVGVGTGSPTSKLQVVGSVLATGAASALRVNEDGSGTKVISIRSDFAGVGPTINVQTADPLVFNTNNTERARFNAGAPILCLSGGNTSATGTGIAFPATQSASSDANTLDDYEEGTWTPTDGSGAGLSFTVSSALYVKVGKLVFINVYLTYPSTASSATAIISGLPFTAQGGNNFSYVMGRTQNAISNGVAWQVNASGTTMTANTQTSSATPIANSAFTAGYQLVSGCYISAS